MTGLTAALVMQAMLLSPQSQSYEQAYAKSAESGRPLLVMIGAPWCPACVTMKQTTIPAMQKAGDFEGVELTIIDAGQNEELASQLMKVTSIPQLILFEHNGQGGWKRSQLIGSQPTSRIKTMLRTAIARRRTVARPVSARIGN